MPTFDSKSSSGELTPYFIRQLEYCRAKPGETIIFLSENCTPRELVAPDWQPRASLG